MTLMIVEDNLNFRGLVRSLFLETFTDIYETSSGLEAVEKYKSKTPDLVFMDINIEKLDGISTTKIILNEFPKAKIVIVSQYSSPKISKAAKDAGAIDYVTKDDLSTLFEIVKNYKNI